MRGNVGVDVLGPFTLNELQSLPASAIPPGAEAVQKEDGWYLMLPQVTTPPEYMPTTPPEYMPKTSGIAPLAIIGLLAYMVLK